MGLDIMVRRVVPLGNKDVNDEDFIEYCKLTPALSEFSAMAFDKTNSYYDIDAMLSTTGLSRKYLQFRCLTFCGGDSIFCYSVVNGKRWMVDKSKQGRKGYSLKRVKPGKVYLFKNPPDYDVVEKCICYENVGYQRKGANKRFYEDGMWDSPEVVKMSVLMDHYERYFSRNTPDSRGGFGSSVEDDYTDEEMSENFKRNIIDKFIEGETFVEYC